MSTPPRTLTTTVSRLLERTATPVPEVVQFQTLHSSPRSEVRRLQLAGTWCGQDHLIAKRVVGHGAGERFGRELVALRLLAELDIDPPVAPKLLAWDKAARLFLLEDLGDWGLATALLGQDRAAAHQALVDYAAALGRLHAGTAGREARATAIRREVAAGSRDFDDSRSAQCDGETFRRFCEVVGVAVDAAFDDDVQRVETLLATPGSFRTLTHGDPCPDNERRTTAGVTFLDFEASGFAHALLDGAYLAMAFPTCWCVGGLPPEVLAEGQAIYRAALATGIPDAANETTFARHLVHASARWLITGDTLVPRAQRNGSDKLATLVAADWPWGTSTARQRLLHRLQAFIRLAENVGELPGLTATAVALQRALASRWPSKDHRLPDFPAFGGI